MKWIPKNPKASTDTINACTTLIVGSDDVAPSHSVGVLTKRQICGREGSRGVRVISSIPGDRPVEDEVARW